jgi:hypothetical protein
MVHKTISAANELRAPPLAQWKRPKLVNHSRKVGIEQFRIRQALSWLAQEASTRHAHP